MNVQTIALILVLLSIAIFAYSFFTYRQLKKTMLLRYGHTVNSLEELVWAMEQYADANECYDLQFTTDRSFQEQISYLVAVRDETLSTELYSYYEGRRLSKKTIRVLLERLSIQASTLSTLKVFFNSNYSTQGN